MEPAYSCYGLSCIDFLDLLILNSVNVNFQGINFSLIFGRLCDNKTCAFVMMGIGKRLCGLEVGGAEVTGQTVSFLLMCVWVFVGRRVGWVGIIRHQRLF